jgi:hypothetical protein
MNKLFQNYTVSGYKNVFLFSVFASAFSISAFFRDKHEVMKDDIIDSPKMIPHGIVNTGEETMRVLVVKAPHP